MSANRCDIAEELSPPSSQRPTLRPVVTASQVRMREAAREMARRLPIQEILARFEFGDFTGALAVAGKLLDERRVPVLTIDLVEVDRDAMSQDEETILALVDGRRSVEEVVEASGLSMLDAFRAMCELAERGLLVLR